MFTLHVLWLFLLCTLWVHFLFISVKLFVTLCFKKCCDMMWWRLLSRTQSTSIMDSPYHPLHEAVGSSSSHSRRLHALSKKEGYRGSFVPPAIRPHNSHISLLALLFSSPHRYYCFCVLSALLPDYLFIFILLPCSISSLQHSQIGF